MGVFVGGCLHGERFINDFFGEMQSLSILIEMPLDCCFNCFDVAFDSKGGSSRLLARVDGYYPCSLCALLLIFPSREHWFHLECPGMVWYWLE